MKRGVGRTGVATCSAHERRSLYGEHHLNGLLFARRPALKEGDTRRQVLELVSDVLAFHPVGVSGQAESAILMAAVFPGVGRSARANTARRCASGTRPGLAPGGRLGWSASPYEDICQLVSAS